MSYRLAMQFSQDGVISQSATDCTAFGNTFFRIGVALVVERG